MAANRAMIEAVVTGLLAARGKEAPSSSYINKMLRKKLPNIKKRKTKTLDIKRKVAQSPKVVDTWFIDYLAYCFLHGKK